MQWIADPEPGQYLPAMHKGEDQTGKVVGGNLILGRSGTYRYANDRTQPRWTLQCIHCEKFRETTAQRAMASKDGCANCAAKRKSGNKSPHWKGGTFVPGYFIAQFKHHSGTRAREIEWSVTTEYLDDLWKQQEGRCAYTGWELFFGKQGKYGQEQTASLDRIDSDKGYVPGNVQFVHKDINRMKWDHSEQWFLELCRTVVQHREANPDE
jgi:hypothetical protein